MVISVQIRAICMATERTIKNCFLINGT